MNVLNFLGFVDFTSTIWNLVAYAGMVVILFGVKSKNYRPHLIGFGAVILTFFAFLFLRDYILTSLQLLIAISGVLEIFGVNKKVSTTIFSVLSAVLFITLIFGGYVPDALRWLGVFGALGIAFGLIFVPHRLGFVSMALGGALLVIYAPFVGAWVFFFLNLIFTILNLQMVMRLNKEQPI
ncbi:hypothetical protein A2926_01440 [Candidatus Giovannonibacteria bacterium RIFCSPLOWO2_01_FULL_44_40]|uniref:Uncharacterized protein n=1 Tax=Candidatus Giovannonibacteria bacterium RIFCSPHIGHO2_01_FULL_45_23 TaxID=1798325 RepID=A0A1F5VFJ1_9BACT|nr:MAG: hypothetical protein A2834_01630 [Candidatus Giovannonibacteria bacterium RIFCSPHIGHO2_01_FULL_45_23]OGF75346.1 MAG: hypothetical protein A3C77_00410 [Candidatus Giovannonibacteria bacterium RIFCSPHIGHO2_02_FULL_45_13]OGF79659.1 MAG: hypothetical protein A2926_01440 [Candidatus Giovannonibacteria bacterium RIFCSPLOWO2_01_FULL_44_40]